MSDTVAAAYAPYRQAHQLPTLEFLKREFEFCEIQDPQLIGKDIIKKIVEKLEFFTKILEEILQPDTNFHALCESSFFDDQAKKQAFQAYRKVMVLYKTCIEHLVDSTPESEASCIKQACDTWASLKKDVLPFVQQMTAGWKSGKQQEVDKIVYLG